MVKKILIAVAGAMVALSASAVDNSKVEKSLELKDGSTVYVFKDGKMGMENKFGRVEAMKPGHVMETKDGERIIMIGNEVFRLDEVLHGWHRN
ncbi:periplasmic Cu(I)/Cu(II)-binding protein CopK [Herbaspirillum sp. ST 5-3]|uniref:periplasmic Cu(I)/Cu(II)-binding protein CopK n=1 Tax=Oxalobacteraceae TaxID=75682 RepID=UPI0010A4D2CE|nr:periplasmic Cu(I)/Cu(II)-binding protein CopK [Herbaspirillum sp. ST 5-3]